MARPTRRQRDAGASLVEFALVAPLLIMLVLGLITGGLALNEKQQMTHATREGARFGATVSADQEFADGLSWASNVRSLIVERSVGSLQDDDNICVSLVEGSPATVVTTPAHDVDWFSTNGGSPCIAGQTYPIDDGVDKGRRVQVTTTKPATIQLGLFGAYDVDVDARATGKAEVGA